MPTKYGPEAKALAKRLHAEAIAAGKSKPSLTIAVAGLSDGRRFPVSV